ncbi:polysaccharide deacetylase family protein [Hazenella coriacea]|uniref:Putative sporulation protein (Polysaccharide deacetylase family) n=1 Tax=Hazenella coriacea TaxID=1179467 RepID=A0A4R3L3X4_9BACL|nr:polysaccharide deacetylase family protein [Hazenella coriacea]TCS92555.1 putative sporulation protein (polysaccharide deacetylase family) [Hazenella coriacea]
MTFPLRVAGLIVSVVFVIYIVQSPPVDSFVLEVKENQVTPVFSFDQEENLLKKKIQEEASSYYIKPIDARIDRVWKAIPGLNGREVDVEATLAKTMKQKDKQKIAWVFREIQPKVTLDELEHAPIYRGNEQKRAAALMINVAWGTEHLPNMLDILRKEQVKATFFLDGSWLAKHPTEAEKIVQEGHEIGNHAYSHPLMSRITQDRMDQEISRTQQLIEKTLHIKSKWFAPPAGDFNDQVVKVASQHGMKTVLWTVDTVDWKKTSSPPMMIRKIEQNIDSGHLILTHPTDRTVEALPQIIRVVKKKGLKLGTVGDVLSSERVDVIE